VIRQMTDTRALYLAAAEQVCRVGQLAIDTTGRFSLVLSGGTTPRPLYELLAAPPFRSSLDWSKVEFFWGDERVVAPDDPRSNFRMAREAMLDKLKIPAAHVHRIRAEGPDLDAAAREYEHEIERVLGEVAGVGRRPPHFNLLLGVKRITMTPPLINSAHFIIFMVTGAAKADVVADVLQGPRDPRRCPAQLIHPLTGEVMWFADREASAKLIQHHRTEA
jgi:6-phosphogluconolactonase